MNTNEPVFAVVGHPNKGKSSIVATLVRQDAIKVSEVSGTTTTAQAFKLAVNGKSLYTLVDTPGFQRPRQVIEWLEERCDNASQRSKVISEFVEAFQSTDTTAKYHDETELLKPITQGAGIIYVVDGSQPYSPEYEAEMTILQWTGKPRMALINPIGGEQFVSQWQEALSQFFSVVRVFDPMTVDEQKQLSVLSAFAELNDQWQPHLLQAVEEISEYLSEVHNQSIRLIADAVADMLQHQQNMPVPATFAESTLKQQIQNQYQQALRDKEAQMQRKLQDLLGLNSLHLNSTELTSDYPDLFDHKHWYLFGLDRQKIVALSASAGAAAGAVVDAGVGGASLMTGAIAGGLVSGAASFLATWKPEKLKIKGVPLAGKTLTAGPVTDINFAFVLLGRALDFLDLVSRRTHADRSKVTLETTDFNTRIQKLSQIDQIKLTSLLHKARKGLSDKDLLQLIRWVNLLASPAKT